MGDTARADIPVVGVSAGRPPSSTGRPVQRWRDRIGVVGWLYAAPTAAVVVLLFILPVALAIWMSVNRWPLIGPHALNFPDNYTHITSDDLFIQGIGFTVLYTVLI